MNGIIIINKEKGYTSHDVVSKVKKILNISKVGHTGTLDPNATGVLPLLLNKGTKLSKYLIEHDKEYEVTLKLGIETDTIDSEGKILKEENISKELLEEENIKNVLKFFLGKQEQIPPMYSAIKVNGKKLYEYARKGEEIEIKPRNIEIYNIELNSINKEEKEIKFKVSCSKGTYIRSLCKDIANKLGTIGYMKDLNRTKVGNFKIEDSITIEELEKNKEEIIKNNVITMEQLLKSNKKITLNKKQLELFLNGVKITNNNIDDIYNIYTEDSKYIGSGIVQNNKLKRDIIL